MSTAGRNFAARTRSTSVAAVALALAAMLSAPAEAGPTWDALKPDLFGSRPIADGKGIVSLKAPTRPDDVRAVPLAVEAQLADGRTIKSVSFIVDENPSPLAAAFTLGGARNKVSLTTKIRLNGQSDVRVVVETSDGALYMVEQLVKFAGGQASCSAPPAGDPAEIAANMGKMALEQFPGKVAASQINKKVKLAINHPNHTGMVMDQITLLYTPLLMVEKVEVRQGDELVFDVAGSITLAQNPEIEFDFKVNGAEQLHVGLKDTSGQSWTKSFPIGAGS